MNVLITVALSGAKDDPIESFKLVDNLITAIGGNMSRDYKNIVGGVWCFKSWVPDSGTINELENYLKETLPNVRVENDSLAEN